MFKKFIHIEEENEKDNPDYRQKNLEKNLLDKIAEFKLTGKNKFHFKIPNFNQN